MFSDVADLAWLAGFIDGEGSFQFRRSAGRRIGSKNYYYPAIRICNTDVPTLATVQRIADAAGLGYNVYWRHPKNSNLSSWDMEARGTKRLLPWLTTMIPYLHTKRSQAEDVLRFLTLRSEDHSQRDYSSTEYEILHRISKRGLIKPRQGVPAPATACKHGHPFTDENTY